MDKLISVLIVDYNTVVVQAITRLLQSTDEVQVVGVADTLDDALTLAQRHQPTVVLVEVQPPERFEGSGLDLIRRLQAAVPATKIVAMSLYEDVYQRMALEAGANAFLYKGELFAELIPALREIAGGLDTGEHTELR